MIHIHELTTRSPLPLCACCSASKSTLLRKGNEIELRRSPLPPAVVAPCLKLGSLSISSDWLLVDDGDGSGDLSWRGFEKQKRNEVYYLSVNCVAGWLFFSFVFCFFFFYLEPTSLRQLRCVCGHCLFGHCADRKCCPWRWTMMSTSIVGCRCLRLSALVGHSFSAVAAAIDSNYVAERFRCWCCWPPLYCWASALKMDSRRQMGWHRCLDVSIYWSRHRSSYFLLCFALASSCLRSVSVLWFCTQLMVLMSDRVVTESSVFIELLIRITN